jgi:nicotinamidase-related amidase
VHIQFLMQADRTDGAPWLRSKTMLAGTSDFFTEGTWGAEICDECSPITGEHVIVKRRPSAFHRTELELVLRAMGVRTVVIIGEQTPGCIDSTARDAVNFDFYCVVVEDCVAAFNPKLHEASIAVLRSRLDVATSAEVVSSWRSASGAEAAMPVAVGVVPA